MWKDWAIYWTLGNFLKPLAATNLSKSATFLNNFCKGFKIYHFSSEIIFGQLFIDIWQLFLVTLVIACFRKGQKDWSKWTTSVEWHFIGQNSDVWYPEIDADAVSGSNSVTSVIVIYDSRVIIWGYFKTGTTLES